MSTRSFVVVLDPGHGGELAVGGSSPNRAVGPNGLREKDLTLDLARRVRALLRPELRVVLTRDEDRNLSLSRRASIARENDAAVFLSLHFDGARDPLVDRTQAWIARNSPALTRRFGESVSSEVARAAGIAAAAPSRRDLGVLLPERHGANTQACLIEIAYLTSAAQASRLERDSYRQELAAALANAVRMHLKESSASTLQAPASCARDIAVTDTMALLVTANAPLPVTAREVTRIASIAGARDDYKSVCAVTPRDPDQSLLIFFPGNNNYVTVAPRGDVPAIIDPSTHSRVPRWNAGREAAGKPASPIIHRFESLATDQSNLSPASAFSSLAVKKPVVLVPEDGHHTVGEYWSVPPPKQYGAPNDGRPAGPGTTRLQDLVMECYEHLRCLANPSGNHYLAEGMINASSWVGNVRRVYLSGHSGGGQPLVECAGADMALVTPSSVMGLGGRAMDLWLFDCTYRFGIHNYVNFCTNWLNAGKLAYGADSTRFVCVYRPRNPKYKTNTEDEADVLRGELAKLLHVKDPNTLRKLHDSNDMTSPSMIRDVIPALTSSPVVFIRTLVGHPDIPTRFIPLLLRTAAS